MNNDLISREALKEVIIANQYLLSAKHNSTDYGMFTTGIMEAIDNAPTVEERPQGEWIMNKTSARGRNYTCTNCKRVSRNKFDFCPKCGADMRGEE